MGETGRILVVDDEGAVREVLCDYFVDRGYAVVQAANGQEALATFARERPDVVLLDIRMPGLDGVQVLKRLREADPHVAVIMVTANEDVGLARETLSIGAFDYVAKPFDFDHLSRMVVAACVHSAPPGLAEADLAPRPADPWSRLMTEVFLCVRSMDAEARASTGVRLEDAALAAAREAIGGRFGQAVTHLIEIRLLAGAASRLGDLGASARSVIDAAIESAEAALHSR
jgi:two-component system, response regulator, stage 0 sporulation protein F